jgi:hypothetical protein
MAGGHVRMDLRRLRIGKNDMSVDALKAALADLELGLISKQVSIRSVRLGQLPILKSIIPPPNVATITETLVLQG